MVKCPVDPIVGIHEQEYMQFLKYYTKATPSSVSFECKGDNSSEADLHWESENNVALSNNVIAILQLYIHILYDSVS